MGNHGPLPLLVTSLSTNRVDKRCRLPNNPTMTSTAFAGTLGMNRRTLVAKLLVASSVLMLAAACSRSDPEKEIRAAVTAMEQAVKDKNMSNLMEHVTDDFTRESGGVGKQDARRMLAGAFLANPKIALLATIHEIKVEGDRANAVISVAATGGEGMLPQRGQGWEFKTRWRKDGSRWKVYAAEWRELL